MGKIQGKIWVTGASGLAGSAVVRALREAGYPDDQLVIPAHRACDVGDPADVGQVFRHGYNIEAIIHCAGAVGGILAHLERPTSFGLANARMAVTLVQQGIEHRVPRFLCLGSVCVYPRNPPIPTREEDLLSGPLEPSNAPYAVAKILGMVLCDAASGEHGLDWLSLQPANLYGPGDRFTTPHDAHVVPAMMNKMHWAKLRGDSQVKLPGNGTAVREFLHADDLGSAVVHVLHNVHHVSVPGGVLNVGSGESVSIGELAVRVADAVGYTGSIVFDKSDRDGASVRISDCTRILNSGWAATHFIRNGALREIYNGVTSWGSS